MSENPNHSIVISPVGVDIELCTPVADALKQIFGYPFEIIPLLENLEFALNEERGQYHSTPVLEKLSEASVPDHTLKILAVTDVDLFIPILTHVYGEAQLGGKSCIVSTFRLKEELSSTNSREFKKRLAKEAVHELGHTFKLLHCKDKNCIMHYCRSIKDVDRKSDDLCRYCNILLDDEKKRPSN